MTVSRAVQQDHEIQSQSYISLLRLYPPTQSSDTRIPPLEYYIMLSKTDMQLSQFCTKFCTNITFLQWQILNTPRDPNN